MFHAIYEGQAVLCAENRHLGRDSKRKGRTEAWRGQPIAIWLEPAGLVPIRTSNREDVTPYHDLIPLGQRRFRLNIPNAPHLPNHINRNAMSTNAFSFVS